MFLDVSLAFVIIRGGAGGRGEMDALEQGCWSGGGGTTRCLGNLDRGRLEAQSSLPVKL
jgi:hypothetical protein